MRGAASLARLVSSLALLSAAGVGAASAQVGSTSFKDLGLAVRVEMPWPKHIGAGYAPMFVELENASDEVRRVSMQANAKSWRQTEHRVNSGVVVPANATVRVELFVPAFDLNGNQYRLQLKTGGKERWVSPSQTFSWAGVAFDSILILTDEDPSTMTLVDWADALGDPVTIGSETVSDASLAAVAPTSAPLRFESYTSLDAVIVDTRSRLDPNVLDPVLAFARLGGTLAFIGPNAERVARATPGVAEWMEERFRVEPGAAVTEESEVYAFAHGRLVIGQGQEFLLYQDVVALREALDAHDSYAPDVINPRRFQRDLPIPGLRDLPYRLFVIVLVLFAILIGPVNFLIVKSTGRPGWLLVTIPCLAFVASVSILAYGIFYQGIELKQNSETFTVLDQRAHRADSVALRSFFAGISPTDGLRPGAGTACFPRPTSSRSDRLYLIDMGPSPVLRGEFLPVRRKGSQVVISERAVRARLTFRPEGDGFVAVNAFSVPVARLCLRAADGSYYGWNLDAGPDAVLEEAVGVGATIELEPLAVRPNLLSLMPSPTDGRDLGWSLGPPPMTYVAVLPSNPFADGAGLEPELEMGTHIVLGVLDEGGDFGFGDEQNGNGSRDKRSER